MDVYQSSWPVELGYICIFLSAYFHLLDISHLVLVIISSTARHVLIPKESVLDLMADGFSNGFDYFERCAWVVTQSGVYMVSYWVEWYG